MKNFKTQEYFTIKHIWYRRKENFKQLLEKTKTY